MALVCLCHGVNERRVRREIDLGASTVDEVAEHCAAGSCCQSCHPTIEAMLAERHAEIVVAAPRRRRFLVA